jgi:hypothetical protein
MYSTVGALIRDLEYKYIKAFSVYFAVFTYVFIDRRIPVLNGRLSETER